MIIIINVDFRLVHNVTKNLGEHGEKLDATVKTEIQETIDSAKSLKDDASLEDMKEKITALTNASMKIGQAMYGNAKTDSNSSTEPEAKDAQYEEKK